MKTSCNILVVGQTGVGKSSLINYLIGKHSATVGVGKPITAKDDIPSYSALFSGVPICLFDSWGIETDKVEDWKVRINKVINQNQGIDSNVGASWFHSVIYCIACGNARVQETDIDMINFFKETGFSVVIALTKADQVDKNEISKLSVLLPATIYKIEISSGGELRSGFVNPFGKENLFISIIQETSKNLQNRVGRYANGLIYEWKEMMRSQLWTEDISRFDNSSIESWIRISANDFSETLSNAITNFTNSELEILKKMDITISSNKTCNIRVSNPQSECLSGVDIALVIAFPVLIITVAIFYGLVYGIDGERKKLDSMINQAVEQFEKFIKEQQQILHNKLNS